MKFYHKFSRNGNCIPERMEAGHYNSNIVDLKEHKETLKKLMETTTTGPTAETPTATTTTTTTSMEIKENSTDAVVKEEETPHGVEVRRHVRQGSCNWCKKQTILLDFSSFHEGREIYCTGLCSDECFGEAAKQIVSIESGSSKPRYIGGGSGTGGGGERRTPPPPLAPAHHPLYNSPTPKPQYHAPPTTSRTDVKVERSEVLEMFVNKECDCGPYLDPTKISGGMRETYTGNMNVLLKAIVEDILASAFYTKTVFNFLKPGLGKCRVATVFNNTHYECRLDAVHDMGMFWNILTKFCDNLRCCPNFVSLVKHDRGCGRCNSLRDRASPEIPIHWSKPTTSNANVDTKFKYSDEAIVRLTSPGTNNHAQQQQHLNDRRLYDHAFMKTVKAECSDEQQQQHRYNIQNFLPFNNIKQQPQYLPSNTLYNPFEQEKENRKTFFDTLSCKLLAGGVEVVEAPKTWQITQVMEFMEKTDLQPYVNTFRENEIDGKALLLLEKDLILNHMSFKLGPAIKLLDIIEELRAAQNKMSHIS